MPQCCWGLCQTFNTSLEHFVSKACHGLVCPEVLFALLIQFKSSETIHPFLKWGQSKRGYFAFSTITLLTSEKHPYFPEEKPEIWQGKGSIFGSLLKLQTYNELQFGSAQNWPAGCFFVPHGLAERHPRRLRRADLATRAHRCSRQCGSNNFIGYTWQRAGSCGKPCRIKSDGWSWKWMQERTAGRNLGYVLEDGTGGMCKRATGRKTGNGNE